MSNSPESLVNLSVSFWLGWLNYLDPANPAAEVSRLCTLFGTELCGRLPPSLAKSWTGHLSKLVKTGSGFKPKKPLNLGQGSR